jgi:2-keto-4-pentenoate hydratase/2-oxohepta-3-ene-1,7-dioic acid hydratase in catechol pathway
VKLVLFEEGSSVEARPGLLTDRGIVDIGEVVPLGQTPQLAMERLIYRFDDHRRELQRLATEAQAIPIDLVRLRSPLPRPGKILACIANYWEHAQREARALNMFMKNPDAVIGPGDTIELPEFTEPSSFMHEAELAIVIKGPAKRVSVERWREAVFGYTCMIDVSARGEGRYTWPKGPPASWLGKSFDTFAPLGPCIVTADEIPDPNNLHVRFWSNEQLRHNYNTDDMEHRVPELVAFATTVMTLYSGDVISCGTNHEGIGNLQDGDTVVIDIEGIGRMMQKVVDPLHRQWERGVYMGENSTHPDALKRHRPTSTT